MGQSASQAAIFYRDIEISGKAWTITDKDGFTTSKRSMPFWSSKSRVERTIKNVHDYKDFEPIELDLDEFYDQLKKLNDDGYLVGVNWSGKMAVGYDLPPKTLIKWIEQIKPSNRSIINKILKRK